MIVFKKVTLKAKIALFHPQNLAVGQFQHYQRDGFTLFAPSQNFFDLYACFWTCHF